MNDNLESEPLYLKVAVLFALVFLAIIVLQLYRITEVVKATPKETVKYINTELNP